VRDATRQELGLVGAVDTDEAAARPVRQLLGSRVRPKCDRAVERAFQGREPLADVELARGRRRLRLSDSDRRAKDRAAVAKEGREEAPAVNEEPSSREPVSAECQARHPSDAPVRQHGQPHERPETLRGRLLAQDRDDVRRVIWRRRRERGDRGRGDAGGEASDNRPDDGCPAGLGRRPVQKNRRVWRERGSGRSGQRGQDVEPRRRRADRPRCAS
jgi:hypothetical protein